MCARARCRMHAWHVHVRPRPRCDPRYRRRCRAFYIHMHIPLSTYVHIPKKQMPTGRQQQTRNMPRIFMTWAGIFLCVERPLSAQATTWLRVLSFGKRALRSREIITQHTHTHTNQFVFVSAPCHMPHECVSVRV